jgi:hypothetical protein
MAGVWFLADHPGSPVDGRKMPDLCTMGKLGIK